MYSKLSLPLKALEGLIAAVVSRLPVKRFGPSEEVAKAAAFLASAALSFAVGSELFTDGGAIIYAA